MAQANSEIYHLEIPSKVIKLNLYRIKEKLFTHTDIPQASERGLSNKKGLVPLNLENLHIKNRPRVDQSINSPSSKPFWPTALSHRDRYKIQEYDLYQNSQRNYTKPEEEERSRINPGSLSPSPVSNRVKDNKDRMGHRSNFRHEANYLVWQQKKRNSKPNHENISTKIKQNEQNSNLLSNMSNEQATSDLISLGVKFESSSLLPVISSRNISKEKSNPNPVKNEINNKGKDTRANSQKPVHLYKNMEPRRKRSLYENNNRVNINKNFIFLNNAKLLFEK